MRGKWWLALIALIVFPFIGVMVANSMPKRYTAGMGILVDTTVKGYDANMSPFGTLDDLSGFSRARSTQTQVKIITGSEVLREAITRTAQRYPDAFRGDNAGAQFESLLRRLTIDSDQFSDVITVRVTMDNPEIAAETANNIGFAFVDYMQRLARSSGDSALQIINDQLNNSKGRLTAIDEQIANVKKAANMSDPNVQSQSGTSTVALLEQRASELRGAYDGIQAELAVARQSLADTPKYIASSTSTQYNPNLQAIDVDLTRERANLQGLRERYLDDHPVVKEAQSRIAQLEKQRREVKSQIDASSTRSYNSTYQQHQLNVANLTARVQSVRQQLSETENELAKAKSKLENLPDVERQLAGLVRQRQVLESNYLQLEQRREILESTGSGRRAVAQIVSPALPPSAPSFPDQRLFMLIGLALGIVVSALIIMPRGDQDIYGQWNQKQAKGLKGRKAAAPAAVGSEPTDAPAIGGAPDDPDPKV
jgi:succinoglycan biosynthesis transport protein ExoP